MTFNVRITAYVRVPAATEIKVEAETEEDALRKAESELWRLDKEYNDAIVRYNNHMDRGISDKYPTPSFYWYVEPDDVENQINEHTDFEVEVV